MTTETNQSALPTPEQTPSETPSPAANSASVSESSAALGEAIALPPLPPPPRLETLVLRWTKFDYVLIALLLVLAYFFGTSSASNADFWRHLATGRALAEGEYQFGVDPFTVASTDVDGMPRYWANHSWLYDLVLYRVWSLAGEYGTYAVVAGHGLLMVAVTLILLRTRAADSGPVMTFIATALALLACSQVVMLNSLVVSYVLFAALVLFLHRGGYWNSLSTAETPCPRTAWAIPLLFAVWVNVDRWFVLGLGLAAAAVLGNGIARLLGGRVQTPLPRQWFMLGGCFAACLLSPHHVHAFAIPPELGYLFGLGAIPQFAAQNPEFLAGGGLVWPFHADYLGSLSVAKAGYFLLVALSLGSFLVVAISSGLRSLPWSRLLAWLAVIALSLAQFRSIPWFGLVAGPMFVFNGTDVARRRREKPGWDPEAVFNPQLGRFACGVLVMLGLVLAWPGWLHGRPMTPTSPRRVVWRVTVDPSLQAAAEALQQDQARRVFNFTNDIASYCAWFAPGVRCYIDDRYELFAGEAPRFIKIRSELRDDGREALGSHRFRRDSEWQRLFGQRQIDHLVLTRFASDRDQAVVAGLCWLQERHWTQRYGDGRAMVFRYSPTEMKPTASIADQWRREAFGPVPPERRAPAKGSLPPHGGLPLEELYLWGQSALPPLTALKPRVHLEYFTLVSMHALVTYEPAWRITAWLAPVGLSGVVPLHVSGPPIALIENFPKSRKAPQATSLFQEVRPRDPGPPEAPILMIRLARQAVHDHPYQADGHFALYMAYQLQGEVFEKQWTTRHGAPHDASGRSAMRELQMIAALRNYLELRPDDFGAREQLAQMFLKLNHLDAVLEELTIAHKTVVPLRQSARDKKAAEFLKKKEKDLGDAIKRLEKDIKRRHEDLKLQAAGMEPLRKFEIAVLKPYRSSDPQAPRGMGLTLEGLKLLDSVSPFSLPQEARAPFHDLRFRLYMQLGKIAEAYDDLQKLLDSGSPVALERFLWYYAVLGNYEGFDKACADLERLTDDRVPKVRVDFRDHVVAMLQPAVADTLYGILRPAALLAPMAHLLHAEDQYQQLMGLRGNQRTLRGLAALELGDTAAAESHFAAALREGGASPYFFDRPIAQRYLELLRAQK
ncbi:MAG: hypothetical protein NZO58_00995 [Gemmataceae bacterium]|nr:hypothetical protein [Gemmataceae bacterium]